MAAKDNTSVQVALRVRPLVQSEVSRGCKSVLELFPDLNQVRIKDTDKAFTFDNSFDERTSQEVFYNKCVSPLIDNLFKGYNVTILAYGQTGSGKTHSMGTAYNGEGDMGVIPRVINTIFDRVNDQFVYDFTVSVSFMELYQEVLYDLLSTKSRDQSVVEIREDVHKSILIPGLTEQRVKNNRETLDCLIKGSLGRATSSTNMNTQSSRSHAIFTINIAMQKKGEGESLKTAKFHLVDLAGSERSKKTGATGQTFKEGININKGLLALGNVISALGEEASYVGYRDSNLTRLLKDSLGGNSITLMIACASPADYNMEETLSTLRYADRAKKIKNKPIVNEDPKMAEINRLNKLVQQLRYELIGQGGPVICPAELELLKKELSDMSIKLSFTVNENTALLERVMMMQSSNEALSQKLIDLKNTYNKMLDDFNVSLEQNNVDAIHVNVTNLRTIQTHLNDLDQEYKKNEEEIRRHEITAARSTIGSDSSEKEIYEKREDHTAKQMEMNTKLQEVTKQLAQKEDLAKQLLMNANYMVDVNEVAENEARLNEWEKEREELLHMLKTVQEPQPQESNNKLTETRRKRIQELESQIRDLRKKVTEQARMIKLKEKDEQKIRQLNTEIHGMKATKVKLIKNMRQEAEKFRQWKNQRERELCKLKDQDRKRQNQIIKMETVHSRQQNVLRRKVEEAAAINKRLKDALALRKATKDHKLSGKIEHLERWIRREFDVFVSTIEAQATLEGLLEDRASLQNEVDRLKECGEATEDLEEDIELRSVQIAELQQKLIDSADGDDKSKCMFDNIQTMAEAKFTLKTLYELIADATKKKASKHELSTLQLELEKKFSEERTQFENNMKDKFSSLEMEYEEKISVLLRQLRGVEVKNADEEVEMRSTIQMQTIERLEREKEELLLTNGELQKKLEETIRSSDRSEMMCTPPKRKKKEKNKENIPHKVIKILAHDDSDEDVIPATPLCQVMNASLIDDIKQDPDWTKTNLGRKVQILRRIPEPLAGKRLYGGGCSCKATCSTRSCGCRKFSNTCSEGCKCSVGLCVNRKDVDNNETQETTKMVADVTTEPEVAKEPEVTEEPESSNVKRKRHNRKYRKI